VDELSQDCPAQCASRAVRWCGCGACKPGGFATTASGHHGRGTVFHVYLPLAAEALAGEPVVRESESDKAEPPLAAEAGR